jgi:aldehyde dehydrogenase (NAD+)
MTKNSTKNIFKASWTYDKAPESTDHIHIKKKYDLYIDGKFTKPLKGVYFDTINPSDN